MFCPPPTDTLRTKIWLKVKIEIGAFTTERSSANVTLTPLIKKDYEGES